MKNNKYPNKCSHFKRIIRQNIGNFSSYYRFEPRTNETNYVYINRKISGCSSKVGMVGGKQQIRCGNCGPINLVHEFFHVLGKLVFSSYLV